MMIVTLDGVYRYNSGGVPLLGYILLRQEEKPLSGQKKDMVSFLICTSGTRIDVRFNALVLVDQKCPKRTTPWPNAPLWAEWSVEAGKLVADQKPNSRRTDFKDIDVGDLPKDYQSVVGSMKRGDPAAFSFTSETGGTTLGIVGKQQM